MKKTLYTMCGLGFSGKSTLAKAIAEHTGATLISQDGIYFEKENELKHLGEDEEWETIRRISKNRVTKALQDNQSVVYDDVNVTLHDRDEMRDIAKKNNAISIVVYLDTPDSLLIERQMKNKETKERHDVSQRHLDEAKNKLEPPVSEKDVIIRRSEESIEDFLLRLDKF